MALGQQTSTFSYFSYIHASYSKQELRGCSGPLPVTTGNDPMASAKQSIVILIVRNADSGRSGNAAEWSYLDDSFCRLIILG